MILLLVPPMQCLQNSKWIENKLNEQASPSTVVLLMAQKAIYPSHSQPKALTLQTKR